MKTDLFEFLVLLLLLLIFICGRSIVEVLERIEKKLQNRSVDHGDDELSNVGEAFQGMFQRKDTDEAAEAKKP